MTLIDGAVLVLYVVFVLVVGVRLAGRAGQDVDEFFLSGRRLPWWIAGTSMVATTFAADTPLVVTGWVRDYGIWKNWLWWCLAAGSVLTVFLFARLWRRGGVMTTAELAELRYSGRDAGFLRGFLGLYHAGITNTLVLCWVMLAAAKILDVLFEVDKVVALALASTIALSYSLLAGFWAVVVTDLVQFAMAMTGAIALAVLAWTECGGAGAIREAAAQGAPFNPETLALFPHPGAGGPFDPSFWTVTFAAFAVYMGVSWWTVDSVDGGGPVVQRIAACRDERHGLLAVLWYNVAHYALRPWTWIIVALASLVVLPPIDVTSPVAATVTAADGERVVLSPDDGGPPRVVELVVGDPDWRPLPIAAVGAHVSVGEVLARTDSERAYVVMMLRYLPAGLLGLAIAALLAAFMSTIDTHVNLAASYFVNDVYRRFVRREATDRHYVAAARLASVGVMAIASVFAFLADSISDLYLFFLAFLGGVGPVYILRWLWWRIRAATEIAAMTASSVTSVWLTANDEGWHLGPLSPDGVLAPEGRVLLVAGVSLCCSLATLLLLPAPDPARLVPFYRRVRPPGFWGPVRSLAPEVSSPREIVPVVIGTLGGLAVVWGGLAAIGYTILADLSRAAGAAAAVGLGAVGVVWALRRLLGQASRAVVEEEVG